MTHVSLFSGIGGIDLAAEWAGFTTIAQVEKDDYCQRVLAKHWLDVHRVADVRDFPDRDYGPVTLVSGGPPCQPASCAGKRKGKADDRWLWPETLRVIRELHPRWFCLENPPGLLSLESGVVFEDLLLELESQGYTVWPLLIPAAGVGAPHLRYRVFIVGHATGNGRREGRSESAGEQGRPSAIGASADVADADESRPQGYGRLCECTDKLSTWQKRWADENDWLAKSGICRVSHGVRNRVDRLRCLGNAVVAQAVYPILQAIAEVERD